MSLKIKDKKIKDLIFAEYNPRRLTNKQQKDLHDSLSRFGIVDPVIVNIHPERENIIIGGHQRTKVWCNMGNETIPCVEVNLPLEKEKELNVRLNKNQGEWDYDALENYFSPSELEYYGFSKDELELIENHGKEDESKDGGKEGEDFDKKIELKVPEETYNLWLKWNEKCKELLGYDNESKAFEFAIIEAMNLPESSVK